MFAGCTSRAWWRCRSASRASCSSILLNMAEMRVLVCATPTRARSLPSFRPSPASSACLPTSLPHTSAVLLTVLCGRCCPLALGRCAQACGRWPACVRRGTASAAAPPASRATSPPHTVCGPTALRSACRSCLLPPLACTGTQQAYYLLGQGGGRPGGGFTAVWGSCRRRRGLLRASSRCRAGVPARAWRRARRRFVADDDGPLGRARRERARLGWARPPGGRRVEGECGRAACSRSCACVCGGRWGGRAAGWRAASAVGSPPDRFFCVWLSCMYVLSI